MLSFKQKTGCTIPLLADPSVTLHQFRMKPQLLAPFHKALWASESLRLHSHLLLTQNDAASPLDVLRPPKGFPCPGDLHDSSPILEPSSQGHGSAASSSVMSLVAFSGRPSLTTLSSKAPPLCQSHCPFSLPRGHCSLKSSVSFAYLACLFCSLEHKFWECFLSLLYPQYYSSVPATW